MTGYREVDPKQAANMIRSRDFVVLDKRDVTSYQQGHINGAMRAHDGLVESMIKRRDHDRPILIYCYKGNTSKDLADLLARFGFKEVYSMSGGYTEWKRIHND
jgi:rhodanese-related sulfurtransferase